MQLLHIVRLFFILIITSSLVMSCKDDDPSVLIPQVTYTENDLSAELFRAGSSGAPAINWNGDQGVLSLNTTIAGLSINAFTGVISWTDALPIGVHEFEVIATNLAGQVPINMTISNPLLGTFTGVYDESIFFEVEFSAGGNAVVRSGDPENPDEGTGTFTYENEMVSVDYEYSSGVRLSLYGSIEHSNYSYKGNWYYGHGGTGDVGVGTFEVLYK